MTQEKIEHLVDATRQFREQLLGDHLRPGYHIVAPEGIAAPFDPNGAIYWQGRYHLFYIYQDRKEGKTVDNHWGHISSTDLFHWRQHQTGLKGGMYSGNCFLNREGNPTICYHQVEEGNAMAVALDDELNTWQKLGVITPRTEPGQTHHNKYRSWDPFGWVDGEYYYAIFGGERPGVAKCESLDGDWRYTGDLLAHSVEGVSIAEDVSCADLFALDGRDVLMCISHKLGCRYFVGEWKDEQFYPVSHAQMSWSDNLFFAPESLVDDQGRRIMWAWLMDVHHWRERWDQGWSGTMSLPRVLSLDDNDEMQIDVPKEIEALRYRPVSLSGLTVAADRDRAIPEVSGDSLEIYLDVESGEARYFGVKVGVASENAANVEETVIGYDASAGVIRLDARRSGSVEKSENVDAGPLRLRPGESLKLRVFIDKSVVEVFANQRQAVARIIYPSKGSVGVSLFAEGGNATVHSLNAWQLSPSNPY